MKTLHSLLSLLIFSTSVIITGCASDGPEQPSQLSLSPKILTDNANHGEDSIIKLSVVNQISVNSLSAYGVKNNLREMFTELVADSLEKQGYEVITDADEEADKTPVYYNLIIKSFSNSIKKSTLSSEITAEISLELRAKYNTQELIKKYNSKRLNEVPLTPSIKEVQELTNLAVAQIIRRIINDEDLKEFSVNPPKP